jgi:hypothetical protein
MSLLGQLWLIEQRIRASGGYPQDSLQKPNAAKMLGDRVQAMPRVRRYIE